MKKNFINIWVCLVEFAIGLMNEIEYEIYSGMGLEMKWMKRILNREKMKRIME